MKTSNNNNVRENKAVLENVCEMSNDELLAMVANELENGGKQDEPGARFKIGDRVRMKHDGATGTIARVWEGYDGFSYEVTRDVPIEGLEPGSEVWQAFPPEKGLEPLETSSEIKDDYKVGDRVKHHGTGEVGTIVSVREGETRKAFGGRRKLYTIDFGRSIIFAFDIEMNMGEYLAEALEPAA